jgi:hypothetical protein
MAGIGKALRGLGLLKKKIKSGVIDRNVKSKEMFKVMKGIKKPKKKYIKRDPYEGEPAQSSDWPYWRGDE